MLQEIVPNVFTFTGLMVGRVYLITQGDGLTLIDASIPPAGSKILAQLKAAGHSLEDVNRILITHAHPDHVGGIVEIQKATGAKLMVPEGEVSTIQGEHPIPSAPTRFTPPETILENMTADATMADGDILEDVYDGLHCVSTPGHAPGHMAYWQPQTRVLFCGDAIFNMPIKMRLPYQFLTVDMAKNIRSIGKIAKLEPEVICFGHGKPVTQNASQMLHEFAKKVGAN